MLVKLSDTVRLVGRLRKNEWVTRTACISDGRAVDIIISDKGLDLLKRIDEAELQIFAIMQNLSKDELQTLNNLLEKLRG